MTNGNPCWSIMLPNPPSVNNLFATIGKRRVTSGSYAQWRSEADDMLWLCKRTKFTGKVSVEIRLGKRKGLADADNFCKPILDWLVRHQVIVNDDSRYVRKVTTEWDDAITGALITVRSL